MSNLQVKNIYSLVDQNEVVERYPKKSWLYTGT